MTAINVYIVFGAILFWSLVLFLCGIFIYLTYRVWNELLNMRWDKIIKVNKEVIDIMNHPKNYINKKELKSYIKKEELKIKIKEIKNILDYNSGNKDIEYCDGIKDYYDKILKLLEE